MNQRLLFSATPTEKRAALIEGGRCVELVVERPDSLRLVGNIYRGKVVTILPGIQSAFVDIGLSKSAFLHVSDVNPMVLLDSDGDISDLRSGGDSRGGRKRIPQVPIQKVLQEGQEIVVQVIKEPIGNKSSKISTQVSLAGRFLVLVPDTDFIGVSKQTSDMGARRKLKRLIDELRPKGVGFIVRTIGLKVSESEFVTEIKQLIESWRKVQEGAFEGSGPRLLHRESGITTTVIRDLFSQNVEEVLVDQEEDYNEIQQYLNVVEPTLCQRVVFYKDRTPLFDRFGVEKDLERALRRKVWLKSGGYLLFDHAEALLAIDVNTGRNTGKSSHEETVFRTNLESAEEICRQLRLRDIGGIIVVDFIDMKSMEHRRRIEEAMTKLLEKDTTATACSQLSRFGLMELTRKRVRPELQELYTDVCSACNGLGYIFSPETVTTRIDRWLKRADSEGDKKPLTLSVHPAVAAYLINNDGAIIRNLASEHAVGIEIVEDLELDQDEFEFYHEGENSPITKLYQ
jgi:ribonuclease G